MARLRAPVRASQTVVFRTRLAALLFGLAIATTGGASGQTYANPRPVPRRTDTSSLRQLAERREIHERFSIGLEAESRNDWSHAATEFERILTLQPGEPQASTARYDLALAYAHSHRLDDAARQFRAAIAGDPGFLAAMANLISVDLERNDLRDARRVADRFAAVAPDSARALYSRGIVALRSGDARTAQGDFGKLLRNDPQYAVAHYDLGIAETQLQHFAAAEREFGAALAILPTYARARVAFGSVLLKEGRRRDAKAAFARAAIDSGDDPALRNLATALRDAITP